MTRSRFYATLLIAFLLLPGCSILDENEADSQQRIVDVSAMRVDVTSASQLSVSFDFKGVLPVPCYEFKEAIVEHGERRVAVQVRAQSTSDYCILVNGILHVAPLVIDVPTSGTYTFEFWRSAETEPLVVQAEVP